MIFHDVKDIENAIKAIIAGLLNVQDNSLIEEASFLELGINSVLSVDLIEAVNQKLGIDLGVDAVFDYKGAKELAEQIASQYGIIKSEEKTMSNSGSKEWSSAKKTNNNSETENVIKNEIPGVAVIGISGRFAGSNTMEEFWSHLQSGDSCIKEINRKGWKESDYYSSDPMKKNKSISKWGGMLENIDKFDALFFNISPIEAERMDPQQRLFLEEAYKALEDAGYSSEQLSGKKVGVFVGGRSSDYKEMTLSEQEINSQTFLGTDMSILAARLSYYLNLKGPSLAVDTACSSSLVALHLACECINSGESDISIAGGVFVICSPEFLIMATKTEMLSPDGKCKSFDNDANGIVVGEGVGALVLKHLESAIEDGDHIYGIIKGSSINQDGRTKGITAPSMLSQKELIYQTYTKVGINPETVSYIEAHGTGTKLGDPIEFKALSESFRMFTNKKQFCVIGSHKPNFGHTIMTAGIAGVFKILMSMKYRQIPPSIPVNLINEHIDLKDSPFFLNFELKKWETNDGIPLRAGVSSFGFSGTNCHVIIEEPPAKKILNNNELKPYYLFYFSARTKKDLKQKLIDFNGWLDKNSHSCSAKDVAYTLSTGRDHFSFRCSFIAKDLDELKQSILDVMNNTSENAFLNERVNSSKNEPILNGLKEYGEKIIEDLALTENFTSEEYKEKLLILSNLYISGYNLNWNKLFKDQKYYRVSLPAYPFDGESYWIYGNRNYSCESYHNNAGFDGDFIHPLLHKNTSDFLEQKYSSIFTGEEFFLSDHQINGRKVLPGVAYLEMARAAVENAAVSNKEKKPGIVLKNVVWARPVVVENEPVKVNIGLIPGEKGEIMYEVYSGGEEEESIVHSQGTVEFRDVNEKVIIDLKTVQKRKWVRKLSSEECYKDFKGFGIDYGPGHRGIDLLFVADNEALAKITMPEIVTVNAGKYNLHPSMLDSAFQAVMGLLSIDGGGAVVPFALDGLEIMENCIQSMWAVVKSVQGGKGSKFDIDICDDKGKVYVRVKGLAVRVMEKFESSGILILEPVWKETNLDKEKEIAEYVEHLVFLCELDGITSEDIDARIKTANCIILKPNKKGQKIGERYQNYALRMIEEIQQVIKRKPGGKVLIQAVVTVEGEKQMFAGLSGILKTAHLENQKIIGQLIELDGNKNTEVILKILEDNAVRTGENRIRYQKGKRLVEELKEVEITKDKSVIPWKRGGVYLITGGLGGLGRTFAKEISVKTKESTIILTGRSGISTEKESWIKELENNGAKVEYRKVDCRVKSEVEDLMRWIEEKYEKLNGIIHIAGVLRDSYLLKKGREEAEEVLSPKVKGLVNLDIASRNMKLDIFILFSSIAGVLGNPGQADYSAANGFMDAYAKFRNEETAKSRGFGKTITMNWPLWKNGGMQAGIEGEKILRNMMGISPMDTEHGIDTLYKSILLDKDQLIVLAGNIALIRKKLIIKQLPENLKTGKSKYETISAGTFNDQELIERVHTVLIKDVSKILKVKPGDIDIDTEIGEYGFDSITFTAFANEINHEFGIELNPTIFFEYPTIHGISQYLRTEYQEMFSIQTVDKNKVQDVIIENEEVNTRKSLRQKFISGASLSSQKPDKTLPEKIAIIGMSGIFPGARDIKEFWNNLVEEKDSIIEISEDRWDWKKYYGDPVREKNKSNIKWGGLIDGVYEFDPLFFGISPREAELMDPQQRLLMTYVWKVIEDAGYSAESLSGSRTGMFIGTTESGYGEMLSKADKVIEGYTSTGIVPSVGPNRMSYFLNLHGPSEPIETACSSSLVAIHRAVCAIENEGCTMAIAGGINTIINPDLHISFNKAGMLCEDGHCKTFSDQANGYVRGEGVGMLFLKKLKAAEEDGDHIYGVIRGTAENHGGRTNSLTAPNPNAQAELLKTAYLKAGIDPRTVTYIEAHGTGTQLGDPIEITGLKTAFKELYETTGNMETIEGHCGIGAVKSNIGHLELAAGAAGVIKVLLQLQHKTLVKSLHCESINPYIELKGSPFYIVSEKREWTALKDSNENEIPRRAGVSSFGFGGVNAHIVIEEYKVKEENKQLKAVLDNPALIVLSAKNEEKLKEMVKSLAEAIESEDFSDNRLIEIAYTLQVGREAMEDRLGFTAGTIQELKEKLTLYLKGDHEAENIYIGQVKKNKETISMLMADEDIQKAIESWIGKKKYIKILELWVKGLNFDWNRLYEGKKPDRISLPSYPFSREIYRIDVSGENNRYAASQIKYIHPLVQENTSDLTEQRFSSVFNGDEIFFSGNRVNGNKVLLEAAYLEMARAAVTFASKPMIGDKKGIRLKNYFWANPLTVGDKAIKVNISLIPEEDRGLSFEIYSEKEGGEFVVYGHGMAEINGSNEEKIIDLKALQEKKWDKTLSLEKCNEALLNVRITYDPGNCGIETVYIGDSEALVKLTIPAPFTNNTGESVAQTLMLDAAFYAVIYWQKGESRADGMHPFVMEEMELMRDCLKSMWAVLKKRVENGSNQFDIDLCDNNGRIYISLRGLQLRESMEVLPNLSIGNSIQTIIKNDKDENDSIMTFEEVWQESEIQETTNKEIKRIVCFLSKDENQQEAMDFIRMLGQNTDVIFINDGKAFQRKNKVEYSVKANDPGAFKEAFENIRKESGEVDVIIYLWPIEKRSYIKDYSCIVYILQGAAAAGLRPERYILGGRIKNGLDRCFLESWIGFERSIGIMMPSVRITGVFEDSNSQAGELSIKGWMERVWQELKAAKGRSAFYSHGKRQVCCIRQINVNSGNDIIKRKGTYLITGGCGGLGFLFAEYLAKTKSVNLILTGRSKINENIKKKIRLLEESGSQVLYRDADVCDAARMKEVYSEANNLFGGIQGIIHAAGIPGADNILSKDMKDFQKVIDPKVKGTLVLDEIIQDDSIDFICYFSSSAAVLGDFGSCDYAIGNRYQMSYAGYRNQLKKKGRRKGDAIVINWPLWREGGMRLGKPETTSMYIKSSGQRLLEKEEGIALFEKLLAQKNAHYLVLAGQKERVLSFISNIEDPSKPILNKVEHLELKKIGTGILSLSLERNLEWELIEQISQILKINRENIGKEENLAEFGFDSISLGEFAHVLNRHFNLEITPAVFFGYSTVSKLTGYLLQEYREQINTFYSSYAVEEIKNTNNSGKNTKNLLEKRRPRFAFNNPGRKDQESIAIIGMSGRFPDSWNIEDMWHILSEGINTVKEYPQNRLNEVDKFKWKCGCIPGVDEFDPLFFEISPREAEVMDPRQRLLLEESWKALEDAGYGLNQIKKNKMGMFVGVEHDEILNHQQYPSDETNMTSNHEGVLAARLAYFLDFNGPVMAINTACSSGLVAAHQACLSLNSGECDTAIAAGIHLMLRKDLFESMNQADVLSQDAKCYTFDKRANGLAAGEAVVAVVLKKLSRAERDGDPIYAVIRSSGINYDGKTNGIMAPSGVAQGELLKTVYEKGKVNPEDIEYVITHGTGTKLGDPVEVNALNKVFKTYTKKQEYCALTSNKTNFGHTFAASGLVSLINMVQAFRYKTIPASLHFEQENEFIQWVESPFYVNKSNKLWTDRNGKRRIGAISAFGMSGTNAHMVLESYSEEHSYDDELPYYLMVLSAKNLESLKTKITDMAIFLEKKDWNIKNMGRLCYTLFEGRQHFNERIAIVVRDCAEAINTLKKYIENHKLPNLFYGKISFNFNGQKAIEQYINELILQVRSMRNNTESCQEKLFALAEFYCQGYNIPWSGMYIEKEPERMNLPTYPFSKEKYQVIGEERKQIGHTAFSRCIHPLLHENTSVLKEQRYNTEFTGREFFLTDHLVKGQKVLPGAVYLEMARAAVEAAAEKTAGYVVCLKNIVWIRPFIVEEKPVKINIRLVPGENSEILFEFYSGNNPAETVIHSQGTAEIIQVKEEFLINIDDLQNRQWQEVISAEECYEEFCKTGIVYGIGHQGIKIIYISEGILLAKLEMPPTVIHSSDGFILHPSILDSAMQAAIGLKIIEGEIEAIMQFSIDRVEIISTCVPSMWAILKYNESEKIKKFDIDLCDDKGRGCVRIKGLSLRSINAEGKHTNQFFNSEDVRDITLPVRDSEMSINSLLSLVKNGSIDIQSADQLLNELSIFEEIHGNNIESL